MSTINFQTNLPKPIQTVWHAWITPSEISKWFSPEANIEPRKGGAYELFWDPSNHDSESTKGCKITEYQPLKKLSFQWKGPDQFSHIMGMPPQTHVDVTFEEIDGQTLVSVTHSGWKQGADWDEAREWHRKAWIGVLADLEKYLTS